MSATHISKILKVSRSWLFAAKKQFSEGAPKDFKGAEQLRTLVKVHRIEAIEPLEGKVSPRSMQDHTQGTEPSGHSRDIAARAHRTEILAQMAEIELATKRCMVPRAQVEAIFARVSRIVKGRLLRMVDDCPAVLLERTAVLRGFSGEAYLPKGRDGAGKGTFQTTENL